MRPLALEGMLSGALALLTAGLCQDDCLHYSYGFHSRTPGTLFSVLLWPLLTLAKELMCELAISRTPPACEGLSFSVRWLPSRQDASVVFVLKTLDFCLQPPGLPSC